MSETSLSNTIQPAVPRKWVRAALAGAVGTIAGGAVGFLLLSVVGPATIYNDALQSPKVTAVWGELEPLPLMISNPAAFGIVLVLLGAVHGIVFAFIAGGLPANTLRRGLLFGLIIWLMSTLYFELQGPYAILAEPLPLVAVELSIGLAAALVEGIVISRIYGQP